ncbi:MAG: hypothetical protein V5A46_03655 [Haloferacaceae archaeon]
MTDTGADRTEPIGEPVVRADPEVTGDRAEEAVAFDPDDPDSLAAAERTVREFARDAAGDDHVWMLRGAAACAALVRGVGSYTGAAERAGEDVSVSFVRKWARLHDLPQSIRRHVARGEIAPSAAKHVARVSGEARYLLAFAVLDADLTVREVRAIASAVNDGVPVGRALREADVSPGELTVSLPASTYVELRRRASLESVRPSELISTALEECFADE